MMKKTFLISTVALFVIFACGKDDDGTQMSNMQVISSASWKFDTAGIDADNNGQIDSPLPPGLIQNCDRDNTIKFNNDGGGIVDEGATKCDPNAPQTANFTWAFNNAQNEINFSDTVFNGLTGAVKIRELTNSSLVLSKQVSTGLPLLVNVLVKLKR